MDAHAEHLVAEENTSRWIGKKRLWAVLVGILGVVAGVAIGLSWKSITSSSESSSASPESSSDIQAPSTSAQLPTPKIPTPAPKPARPYKPGFANADPNRPIFYFVGDSITQYSSNPATYGFIDRYSNDFVRSVDVFNRGIENFNTTQYIKTALPILGEELTKWVSPALISVWFGVNDASIVGGSNGSLHVPVDEYQKNLITIIESFQKFAPDATVVLVTPATVDDAKRRELLTNSTAKSKVLDHMNNETAKYAEACREVVKLVKSVTLIDPFRYFMETYPNATKRGEYQSDGLHYTADGNYLVYEMFRNVTNVLFPNLTMDTLQIPDFHDLHDYYPENQANNTVNGTVPRLLL